VDFQKFEDFVDTKITLDSSCPYGKDVLISAFDIGLGRICDVNPNLVMGITTFSLKRDLTVICDVGTSRDSSPYFLLSKSEIHLRQTGPENVKTRATFIHEFLHYVGLPYDRTVHEAAETGIEQDPVFACHFTAFPEILWPTDDLEAAQNTCGTRISYCNDGNICWTHEDQQG